MALPSSEHKRVAASWLRNADDDIMRSRNSRRILKVIRGPTPSIFKHVVLQQACLLLHLCLRLHAVVVVRDRRSQPEAGVERELHHRQNSNNGSSRG